MEETPFVRYNRNKWSHRCWWQMLETKCVGDKPDDKFSCILKARSSIKAKCHEQDNLLFDTGNELPYNLKWKLIFSFWIIIHLKWAILIEISKSFSKTTLDKVPRCRVNRDTYRRCLKAFDRSFAWSTLIQGHHNFFFHRLESSGHCCYRG